jgi:hypothetical protein
VVVVVGGPATGTLGTPVPVGLATVVVVVDDVVVVEWPAATVVVGPGATVVVVDDDGAAVVVVVAPGDAEAAGAHSRPDRATMHTDATARRVTST